MDCFCGKEMILLGKFVSNTPMVGDTYLFSCHPTGCGRIFLGETANEKNGTWYQAEQNSEKKLS